MKYSNFIRDVENVFASDEWKAEGITTIPSNYIDTLGTDEFLRIETVPVITQQDYAQFGLKGQIIIQIYTPAGQGVMRLYTISDILDRYLQGKSFTNGTATSSSVISILGSDSVNPALFRADYSVDFTHF